MTPSKSPSRRRSEAVKGGHAVHSAGSAAFNGSSVMRERTGRPGQERTATQSRRRTIERLLDFETCRTTNGSKSALAVGGLQGELIANVS